MPDNEKNVTRENIVGALEKNFMPYAMSVIVSRAIPEIDGFKPSHRKLLYTMYKMGLLQGNKTKSANVVGQTMKLNPHGDMAIYETLVRLSRGYDALIHPYIDSKGNFGKHYSRDMTFAASRYTECKLDKICEELFNDLDKDTVDFTDNYDGTMKEPTLLPTTFPNILVNANQGIAVGMASNICSFNLREVCEATIAYIDDENCDLLKYIKGPDFSTGGEFIYKRERLLQVINTGKGNFDIRARYRFDKKNSCIEIYEIPYTTTSEAIIDSIIALVKAGKIKDIVDIRDETGLNGMKITIDIKKSTDPDQLMNKLFRITPLQDTFSCNFNVLINGRPKLLGIRGILKEWVKFRSECIKRQIRFDINKKEERLHLLKGLKKILLDIDKAIKIIRETDNDALVVPNLMWGFGIDEVQAEFVAEIKLRNLNKDYILNKVEEIESLTESIRDLNETLNSEEKIKSIIKKHLAEVAKKYGIDRKTGIISEENIEEITEEHFIEDYNLKLFLSKEGYLKKIPLVSLRASPEHKMKDDDYFIQEIEWHNKSEVLFFSSKHAVYKVKIHEINECKASALGEYLPNLLNLEEDETIIKMVVTDDYAGYLLFAFRNGRIAKINLSSYATKTNRKKLINAYSDLSPIVDILYFSEDTDIAVFSNINKVLVVNTGIIAPKSKRDSQGVMVMKEKKNSYVVKVVKADESGIKNLDYYRTKNIPAVGAYLKEEDNNIEQLTLI